MDSRTLWIVLLTILPIIAGQCTFPDSFNGTWITSYDGTWVTNSTHLLGYKAISPTGVFLNSPNPTLDFTCFLNNGTKYLLQTTSKVEIFTDLLFYIYTCLDLREITSSKYVFYYGTKAEPTGLRFNALTTLEEVCTQTDHDQAYNQHIALLNGSETSGQTLCPPSIYGSYFYNTCTDTNSNTTDLDVCDSRQQLIFNYTLCDTLQMFTSEGVLDCLFYDDVDTVSYVTLYNRDSTTPNGSTTYQFVCLAIELNGTTVHITANPETCTENQSPLSIASPGQTLELEPYFLCPFTDDESPFDFLPIILGIVGFLILVIIIIIIYCCCKHCKCCNKKKRKKRKRSEKKKKKKKKNDEEAPSDDEDDRDSESDSSKDSESTRSTSSSKYEPQYFEEDENKSVDSGISEPAEAHKKDGKDGDEGDEGQTEKVLVIYYEVENELDDKTSRPHSGQASRMSDLPPSTFTDDDQPGTSRSDPEQHIIQDDNLEDNIDETQLKDPPETEETNDKEEDTPDKEEEQPHKDDHVIDDEGSGEEEESEDDNDDGANDNEETIKENDEVQKETKDDEKDQTEEPYDSEHIEDNDVQKEDNTDEEDNSPIEDEAENGGEKEHTLEEQNVKENDGGNESGTEADTVENESVGDGKVDDDDDERAEPEQETGEPDMDNTSAGDDETSRLEENIDNNKSDVNNEDTIIKENNETQQIKHEQNDTPDNESEDDMNEVTRDNEDGHPHVIVVAAPKHQDADAQSDKNEETEEESEDVSEEDDDEDPPNEPATDDQEHVQQRVIPDDDKSEPDEKDEQDKEPATDHETEKEVILVQPTRFKDEDDAGDNDVAERDPDNHREDSDNDEENVKTAQSENKNTEDDSKEEATGRKKQHTRHSSDEEMSKDYHKIGGKKGKGQQEFKSLTTVLVSRDEEDRRRNKNREKSKNQKMRRLAKRKTLKHGTKGGKEGDIADEDDYMYSSEDDEKATGGGRQAPFMAQYNNKKRIEHILEQQHYWSDPDAEESFGINDNNESTVGSSGDESDSDYEELIGPDGVIHRVKRSKHTYNDKDDLEKEIPGTKRPKSVESMASVEDPESPGGHVSKKRQNEHHAIKSDDQERKEEGKVLDKNNDATPEKGSGTSTPKLIYVKEKKTDKKSKRDKDKKDHNEANDGTKTSKGRKKTIDMGDNVSDISDIPSDFCDTDMDKLSERDSGLDDDEAVDVVLNTDQQAMIVAMLFDEEMNLRPQFARDDAGRIIRRLDNTVIYDPHTGRLTFHKQLGKIFNVPRLKRDTKGRPIGGYVDDPFGPHESDMRRRTPGSGHFRRTASGKSIRTHVTSVTGSPSPEMKRSRGEGKFVGFAMPIEDDIESVTTDQVDINIRGRRDIGSAIRRKLNKRLFRKKKRNPAINALPDITLKRAWGQDGTMTAPDQTSSSMGTRGLTTLGIPFSRSGPTYGTPGTQRRQPGTMNPEQQQMYKQGLERDRKILEERQDKLNKKPFEAFIQQNGDAEETDDMDRESVNGEYDSNRSSFYGQSFYNDDGRLVIRERGCTELHRPSTFFTIVRRQEDLEAETAGENDENARFDRVSKSAPESSIMSLPLKSRDASNGFHKENTFHNGVRRDGSDSQLSGIDNNRLRRLLEELYKDKKYFDKYIKSTEPDSEEFTQSKGLAEHGRGYLLERAEYWDKRGPLPPKPPMTEIGWKMHRQQTLIESRLNSDRSSAAILNMSRDDERETVAPPGVIEEQSEAGTNGDTDVNESHA